MQFPIKYFNLRLSVQQNVISHNGHLRSKEFHFSPEEPPPPPHNSTWLHACCLACYDHPTKHSRQGKGGMVVSKSLLLLDCSPSPGLVGQSEQARVYSDAEQNSHPMHAVCLSDCMQELSITVLYRPMQWIYSLVHSQSDFTQQSSCRYTGKYA